MGGWQRGLTMGPSLRLGEGRLWSEMDLLLGLKEGWGGS